MGKCTVFAVSSLTSLVSTFLRLKQQQQNYYGCRFENSNDCTSCMRGPTPYSTYVYQTPRASSTVFSIVLRLRTLGSCALHMCLVAAGCIDAHYSQGISVWDIAAGWLIVREAGGVVLDTAGLVLVMAASCTTCALLQCFQVLFFVCTLYCRSCFLT